MFVCVYMHVCMYICVHAYVCVYQETYRGKKEEIKREKFESKKMITAMLVNKSYSLSLI